MVVGAAILLWQRPWSGDATSTPVPVPSDADELLTDQIGALGAASSRAELREAAGPGERARAWADATWAARRDLGVGDVAWRYVDGGQAADRADGTVTARVEVAWRPVRGSVLGTGPRQESTVALRLAPTRSGGFAVRSVSRDDGALPPWLAGPVRVVGAEGATVVEIDGGVPDRDLVAQARTASRQVRAILPETSGRLVVLAPASQRVAAGLLDRPVSQVRDIAAVTTTLDSTARTSPVVVLNPSVYASMDERASQVVMTHEATHLLSASVGRDVPAWVAEGFADYVALARDRAPLSVSAGQVLRQVDDGDLPARLPTEQDFASATHLGAVYESAWLAFRLLDERYGERRVVGFYDSVLGGTSLERALDDSFGLGEASLTRLWRAYLTKMASTVS